MFGRGVLITKQFIIQLFLQHSVSPSLLCLIFFLSTFFSNIHNVESSINVRDQVLHSYKQQANAEFCMPFS